MELTAKQRASLARRAKINSLTFLLFSCFLTLCFFAAIFPAIKLTSVSKDGFWSGLIAIFTGPSKLVTDYFALGGLAPTLFNAGICGLACNLFLIFSKTQATSTTFAAYILVIAHCFYGLNFVNMWPPFIGVILYCIMKKLPLRDHLHIAMFSTALAPFISDFLFYYPLGSGLRVFGVNVLGILLSLAFGLLAGFLVPALLPGTTAMHRGYSLFRAGLAIGMLGIFVYCFLYKTLGLFSHDVRFDPVDGYVATGTLHFLFMNIFFATIFLLALLLGFFLNGRSFKNYSKLLSCTGHGIDFADQFGMPLCFINFGIYGFCILIYLNIVFLLPQLLPFLPDGVGFTGPTAGVVFAALTFAADGQHPKNVAPIALGYSILFAIVCVICAIAGLEIPWTLSTQAYINGLAFATGLCPIAGAYGFRYGVIAGVISAIICTSTASMHGGFVLYNGGFNAGLTALILIPILDFYKITPRPEETLEDIEIPKYKRKPKKKKSVS